MSQITNISELAKRAEKAEASVSFVGPELDCIYIMMDLIDIFPKYSIASKTCFFYNLELLDQPDFEQQVIEFYLNFPHKIPQEVSKFSICKVGPCYYYSSKGYNNWNKAKTCGLRIDVWYQIDINYCRRLAGRNLLKKIDEDLSLGDQLRVMRIGSEAFDYALETSILPEGTYNDLNQCLRTDINEAALGELKRYGFPIKKSLHFIDVNLKR